MEAAEKKIAWVCARPHAAPENIMKSGKNPGFSGDFTALPEKCPGEICLPASEAMKWHFD